ncbi:MAG: ATP-binding cassette domain-containing protein [Candidatus Rokubacteria bacterium]|nr:ATP-binding cassette domain-containing protein [Candidatus Rokubacteria bacterium]
MSDAIVEVIDLWKSFDANDVLRGLTFSVARGETLVIMGGSGSGKTVLLRHVAGLLQQDRGQVRTFGINIEHLGEEELLPIRRRMGYVFQGGALFDSLSTYENVAYPLREHTSLREDEIRDRVVRHLGLVGLGPDILPLLPAELSGGMRKRVGIARALTVEPEILLFDEPTAGLDPTNSRMVADLIGQLRTGVCDTAIVVTHDLDLTRAVADRVAILIEGQFAALGALDAVLASDDAAVQAFLSGDMGSSGASRGPRHSYEGGSRPPRTPPAPALGAPRAGCADAPVGCADAPVGCGRTGQSRGAPRPPDSSTGSR